VTHSFSLRYGPALQITGLRDCCCCWLCRENDIAVGGVICWCESGVARFRLVPSSLLRSNSREVRSLLNRLMVILRRAEVVRIGPDRITAHRHQILTVRQAGSSTVTSVRTEFAMKHISCAA
jgi:hypothetical protein